MKTRDINTGAVCRKVMEAVRRGWCEGDRQGLSTHLVWECNAQVDEKDNVSEGSVVSGLRCCKSEQHEDLENTFEFGQEMDTNRMLLPVGFGAEMPLQSSQEKLGDEEGERQHACSNCLEVKEMT